jgi:hypothetical protein
MVEKSDEIRKQSAFLLLELSKTHSGPMKCRLISITTIRGTLGLIALIEILESNSRSIVTTAIKILKNLCTETMCLHLIDIHAGTDALILLLHRHGTTENEIRMSLLSCLYALFRLDKNRMDRMVTGRTFEILLEISGTATSSNQFAIPILCEFVCSTTCPIGHSHELFRLLSDLIAHSCWRTLAFEALLGWISHETEVVLSYLLARPQAIVSILQNSRPRLETDSQSVAQIQRLCSVAPRAFDCMVDHNLMGYLNKLCFVADAKLSLDILKIIQSFIRANQNSARLERYKNIVQDCMHIMKKTQNSAVVLAQVQFVEGSLNKSLHP